MTGNSLGPWGDSQTELAPWRAFLETHAKIVARLERELSAETGLGLAWYEVLLILQEAPDGTLRMGELADRRLLSRSAATRLIDRMEKVGLVERIQDDADRRGTNVRMTDDGRAVFRKSAPIHRRGIEEHFLDQLTAEELSVMGSAMKRVLDGLDQPG